jgi:peptidyl-prolyl cis-trans isomerase C
MMAVCPATIGWRVGKDGHVQLESPNKLLRWSLTAVAIAALATSCSSSTEEPAPGNAPAAEAASPSPEPAEAADPGSFPEVVAKVNGTEIHKDELMERVTNIEAQARGAIETSSLDFYRRVLDELVGAELLFQESQSKGLLAEDAEVDRQLDSLKSRLPDEAAFEQALSAEGLTLEGLKKQMRRDMSIQKLIEQNIAPAVAVTDADMRAFYDENTEQMRQPDQLRVSHILKRVPPDATPEAKDAAREEIAKLREQAAGGADFAALAREHSDDPGSASNGGELLITRGQTVPPFEEAAFALEPGGLSNVVETQFGFHVIKLSERLEGRVVPFEQARPRIEQYLKQQGLQKAVESAVDTLRGSGSVETYI